MECVDSMSQTQRLKRIADKLFLQVSDEFHLKFEKGHYVLKNPKHGVCHLLEICLIAQNNCTGNKVSDISKILHVPVRWVLGFHHAFRGLTKKYKNSDYFNGYLAGEKARQELVLVEQ